MNISEEAAMKAHMNTQHTKEVTVIDKSLSEEWGAWKFVSEMLDVPHTDKKLAECGIYNTSKCYEQIHDFVVEQKASAKKQERARSDRRFCVMVSNHMKNNYRADSMIFPERLIPKSWQKKHLDLPFTKQAITNNKSS